ncbi:hypothetical protein DICVIV_06606 [Dictyocaulus viviparus]|uniref:Uncharacterized protein n=1 Tax=Dictyocaulus viviparus TaxID=29172 RepID=A0A0D8XS14_DICVI|nr:hypothetical protein DICVIV_06606 [Dictyocaulus viviparus]
MSIIESLTLAFERDVEQIEAELGDDHLIRMLQCLMSNSSEADQGLIELHLQCQNVISKYPPLKSYNEELKQRTKSQRSSNHNDEESTRARIRKLQSEKSRIITKNTHSWIPSKT